MFTRIPFSQINSKVSEATQKRLESKDKVIGPINEGKRELLSFLLDCL